jgi:hypothetical protein
VVLRFKYVPIAAVCAATSLGGAALAGAASHGEDRSGGKEGRALFATLAGANEISPDGRRGAGDPDGRGTFTAIVDGDQLCFGLTVANIDAPVAAHIHKGRRSQNGPVVVPLVAPSTGDPGASAACVDVAAPLARDILKHPRRYYANVHTPLFAGGAVRGQLTRR